MDTSQSSEASDCSDQPQSSKDSNSSKGLTAKTYSGATGVNFTTGEQGKDTVGMEVDQVKIDGKLVNITPGAPPGGRGSTTTGVACKEDMHVDELFNVTGPANMSMEEVARLRSLFCPQAGASTQPEKVKNPPAKTNDHRDLDDIIKRIEQLTDSTYSGYDLPLKEFLRPNLPKLCATTGNGMD